MHFTKSTTFYLPVLVCIAALLAFTPADDDLIATITKQLEKFKKTYTQEKVYLHLDKPYYVAGEDIWYKAYLVNGTTHVPDSVSKNIYVELVAASGEIVHKNILKVKAGAAAGDFELDDSLEAGAYQIRAYTNWMRNFSDDYFFTREIKIYNDKSYAVAAAPTAASRGKAKTDPNTQLSPSATSPILDVQFFPEGGNLVVGIESRIGFKAVNRNGKGENITGTILDQAGQEVGFFQGAELGMGNFTFLPEAGKTYTAQVKTANGNTLKIPLPKAQEKGFVLQASNFGKDIIRVAIQQNVTEGTSGKEIVLVGQSRGEIYFAAKVLASGKTLAASIPKANFPSGVAQLTLFDAVTKEPLCERLVFINKPDNLNISVKADKPQYKSREKVELNITATDQAGNPVSTNLSLAVTDGKLPAEVHGQSLNSYLLLVSDLQGHIEQPGFYFKDNSMATQQALDNLLLTQGWRRFIWKEIIADKMPQVKYSTDRGLRVGGQIKQIINNKPAEDGKVLVSVLGPSQEMIQTKIGTGGKFYITDLDFYGTSDLFVQGETAKGNKRVTILLEEDKTPPLRFLSPASGLVNPESLQTYIRDIKNRERMLDSYAFGQDTKVLQDVNVTAKKVESKSAAMYSTPEKVVKVDKTMENFDNILSALMGKTAGLQIMPGPDGVQVRLRGGTPLLLLDGFRSDAQVLSTIHPSDVDYVDIVKSPSAALQGSDFGVIAVYLKKGGIRYAGPREGSLTTKLTGYYKAREFYSPSYAVKKEEHNLPDKRSTLYWNPTVKTDAAGKASVTFYNADGVTTLQAIVEGISDRGAVGSNSSKISGN